MKNYITILAVIVGMLMMPSCADPEKSPIITFDKAEKGAYPRLVQLFSGEYDLDDLQKNPTASASEYKYEIEFVDLEQGATVDKFEIFASFEDNNPDNGDLSKDQVSYKVFNASDFVTNADGFQGLTITIPAREIISFMGLTIDDLVAGDFFEFESVITTVGGAVHTGANSTSTINGSAFAGWFDFGAKVTCPLEDSEFAGTYKLTYVDAPTGAYGAIFGDDTDLTIELKPVSGSTTLRRADMVYLPGIGGFDVQLTLEFVCDVVEMPYLDTGVGCGGSIGIAQGDVTPFDIEDDATFTVNMVEFDNDGGCGVGTAPVSIVFTKQ